MDKQIEFGLAEEQKKNSRKFTSGNTVVFTSLRSQQTTDPDRTANEQFFATGYKKSPVPPYKINSAVPTHQKKEHDPLLYYLKKDKHA